MIDKVFVITENLSGHRRLWVKLILQECKRRKFRFSLLVNELVSESDELRNESYFITIHAYNNLKRRDFVLEYQKLLEEEKHSHFVFLEADKFLPHIYKGKSRCSLIIMRPYCESLHLKAICKYVIKRILIYIQQIRGFNIGLLSIPGAKSKLMKNLWINDLPLLDEIQFPAKTSTPIYLNEVKYVLIPGFIDLRKNPRLAIEAFRKSLLISDEEIKLVFAGKISDTVIRYINANLDDSILVFDRFLDNFSLRDLIQNAKAVLLPYSNKSSSGLVLESANIGTPVILAGSKLWINAANASNGNLYLVGLNKDEIVEALLRVYSKPKLGEKYYLLNDNLHDFRTFIFKPLVPN